MLPDPRPMKVMMPKVCTTITRQNGWLVDIGRVEVCTGGDGYLSIASVNYTEREVAPETFTINRVRYTLVGATLRLLSKFEPGELWRSDTHMFLADDDYSIGRHGLALYRESNRFEPPSDIATERVREALVMWANGWRITEEGRAFFHAGERYAALTRYLTALDAYDSARAAMGAAAREVREAGSAL